jgi:hypothetical protein
VRCSGDSGVSRIQDPQRRHQLQGRLWCGWAGEFPNPWHTPSQFLTPPLSPGWDAQSKILQCRRLRQVDAMALYQLNRSKVYPCVALSPNLPLHWMQSDPQIPCNCTFNQFQGKWALDHPCTEVIIPPLHWIWALIMFNDSGLMTSPLINLIWKRTHIRLAENTRMLSKDNILNQSLRLTSRSNYGTAHIHLRLINGLNGMYS